MPCDDPSHDHKWPTSGPLQIERCERYCAYCRDPKSPKTGKEWESARHLRKHVEVHTKPGAEFEYVIILKGKTGRPFREKSPPARSSRKMNSYRMSSASRQDVDYGDDDEDESLRKSSSNTPGLGSSASRPAAPLSRDRGAKKRAQEQIKISAALSLIYEPDPPSSPEPDVPMGDVEDGSIIFSDEESSVSKPRASAAQHKQPSHFRSRHEGAVSRPRIGSRFPPEAEQAALKTQHQRASILPNPAEAQSQISPVNDAGTRVFTSQRVNARPQAATAAAERSHRLASSSPSHIPARRPDVSEIPRLLSRGRGGRPPRTVIRKSRTSDDGSEDLEPQSPPQPSAEALNRIQQHEERREREMRGPRHSNAGKRHVQPIKDYSQLWLKEFEPSV